jgi:predicted dehydrogenase
MSTMAVMRTAVVGAGKMGSIHAKVYHRLADCHLVAVVDSDVAKAKALAERFGCASASDVSEILDRVDAVTIATPTATHLDLAKVLLRRRIPVLVEKPLAATVGEGRQIVSLAKRYDTVVAVGHSERCNPVVQALSRLAIEPRFIETVRVSPFPFRSMDVGVVLDVMIHDIDIVLSLAASPLRRVEAVGAGVIGDAEDICNARLVFANGCVANLTASRLALKTERRLRVFTAKAYLSVDYFKKTGVIIRAESNQEMVRWIQEHHKAGDLDPTQVNWQDMVHVEPLVVEEKEPVRLEQEAFLAAVRDRTLRPQVTAEEGLAALCCAQRIIDGVKKHPWA